MRIDAFTHVRPERYTERAKELLGGKYREFGGRPELWDLDARIRHMDEDGVDMQVITHTVPPVEQTIDDPTIVTQLATASNDAIYEMTARHPDRLIPIGVVPMCDAGAAIKEGERCLDRLGMKGLLVYTNANGRLLHDPALLPFFEFASARRAPLWMHPYFNPTRNAPEYGFGFGVEQVFGWPFDTTVAMTCLVYGGVLDRFPDLVFVTHHAGAMVPFFDRRIATHSGVGNLAKPVLDYFRMFYVDTAVQGSGGAMHASLAFYGPDHMLFGTDTPYASEDGRGNAKETMASVETLTISPDQKEQVFSGNLRRLLRL
jgi:predicted TIM-barrel fold metal-dependent hydrolase